MSEQPQGAEPDEPALVKNCTMDAIVAAIVFAVGALVVFEARALGATWTDDGPGSGYFPYYIGLILCIASLGVLYQALLSKSRDGGGFVSRAQLSRVASVFVPAVVFVLGIALLGIYIAAAVYIALFMIVLGRYPPLKSVLLGVAVSAFLFLMFEVWFKVPLFKGHWNLLDFLGY